MTLPSLKSITTAHSFVPLPTQYLMSLNEKPHDEADTNETAATAAVVNNFLLFIFVLSLLCEGMLPWTRNRLLASGLKPPPPPSRATRSTGNGGFVSGHSCATAPESHGLPLSASLKRPIVYRTPPRAVNPRHAKSGTRQLTRKGKFGTILSMPRYYPYQYRAPRRPRRLTWYSVITQIFTLIGRLVGRAASGRGGAAAPAPRRAPSRRASR